MSPELAKKLQRLIAMEKNLERSMENASTERMDNAVCLNYYPHCTLLTLSAATTVLVG